MTDSWENDTKKRMLEEFSKRDRPQVFIMPHFFLVVDWPLQINAFHSLDKIKDLLETEWTANGA